MQTVSRQAHVTLSGDIAGMVFEVVRGEDRLSLEYIAFGVRHHPRGSHAHTVYQLAHRRLHG